MYWFIKVTFSNPEDKILEVLVENSYLISMRDGLNALELLGKTYLKKEDFLNT
jgi:hypothetical protein